MSTGTTPLKRCSASKLAVCSAKKLMWPRKLVRPTFSLMVSSRTAGSMVGDGDAVIEMPTNRLQMPLIMASLSPNWPLLTSTLTKKGRSEMLLRNTATAFGLSCVMKTRNIVQLRATSAASGTLPSSRMALESIAEQNAMSELPLCCMDWSFSLFSDFIQSGARHIRHLLRQRSSAITLVFPNSSVEALAEEKSCLTQTS
mmetsp:Transcript_12884/g.36958  ORF Transcript_12884/g.36958 Transcript_12884/m.36958 type:complete len:200 (-) Transcript_12884:13-612(-)